MSDLSALLLWVMLFIFFAITSGPALNAIREVIKQTKLAKQAKKRSEAYYNEYRNLKKTKI